MPRRILYWLPALLLLGTVQLRAYVDPGSGSFLIQMLIAGILGVSLTLKTLWRQFKSYISRRHPSAEK